MGNRSSQLSCCRESFGLYDRFFESLSFGDVLAGANPFTRASLTIQNRHCPVYPVTPGTILSLNPVLLVHKGVETSMEIPVD